MKKLRKGFTLIELLVVVAIIAILATIVLINVAGARAKAINAKVLSELADDRKEAIACIVDSGTVSKPANSTPAKEICTANKGIGGTWANLTTGYGTWSWSVNSTAGDTFQMLACSDGGSCANDGKTAYIICTSTSTCVSGTTTTAGGGGIPITGGGSAS